MRHRVEFLYFDDCPNHEAARALLDEVIARIAPGTPVEVVNATDPAVAEAHRFPGSPTIRVDGRDVMPGFVDPGDYTPRCRVYPTPGGLRRLPAREWLESALASAAPRGAPPPTLSRAGPARPRGSADRGRRR